VKLPVELDSIVSAAKFAFLHQRYQRLFSRSCRITAPEKIFAPPMIRPSTEDIRSAIAQMLQAAVKYGVN
jgi:hypothetical protein